MAWTMLLRAMRLPIAAAIAGAIFMAAPAALAAHDDDDDDDGVRVEELADASIGPSQATDGDDDDANDGEDDGDDDGRRIEIRLREEDGDGNRTETRVEQDEDGGLEIRIRDEGSGLDLRIEQEQDDGETDLEIRLEDGSGLALDLELKQDDGDAKLEISLTQGGDAADEDADLIDVGLTVPVLVTFIGGVQVQWDLPALVATLLLRMLDGALGVESVDLDSDGDGVADSQDAFPLDRTEAADTDGDGLGDNADAFPRDPDQDGGPRRQRRGRRRRPLAAPGVHRAPQMAMKSDGLRRAAMRGALHHQGSKRSWVATAPKPCCVAPPGT